MQIMNTFVAKMGPGGKRNRAKRRRMERRGNVAVTFKSEHSQVPDDLCNEDFGLVGTTHVLNVEAINAGMNKSTETLVVPEVDLSTVWDEPVARKALAMFENSGKSQRAFAAEHGFPESRLRSWKKKLETLATN